MTNVPESYRMGIELIGGVKITPFLQWEGNVTFSKNEIKNYTEFATFYDTNWGEEYKEINYGSTQISYSPSVVAASVLSAQSNGFRCSYTTKYVGEQYFDNTTNDLRKLDAYLINNFHIGYELKLKGIGSLDFQFNINNFLNEEYSNNAYGGQWFEENPEEAGEFTEGSWAYYFPQAPRHYMLKVKFTF